MKAVYTVPPCATPPDWGIMLHLLHAPIKADKLKKCTWPPCDNEFRSTNRQHQKEFCSDECRKKAEALAAKARRAARTHRRSKASD